MCVYGDHTVSKEKGCVVFHCNTSCSLSVKSRWVMMLFILAVPLSLVQLIYQLLKQLSKISNYDCEPFFFIFLILFLYVFWTLFLGIYVLSLMSFKVLFYDYCEISLIFCNVLCLKIIVSDTKMVPPFSGGGVWCSAQYQSGLVFCAPHCDREAELSCLGDA